MSAPTGADGMSQENQSLGGGSSTLDKTKERDPILEDLGGDDDDGSLNDPHKPAVGSLYVAPIERYVDDGELYQQRYNDYSRVKYWEFLLDRPRPPKLPHGHQSWSTQGGNSNFAEEIRHYPTFEKRLLAFTVHLYWDYAYLYLFGLWIILMTAYYDSLVRLYILIPTYLLYFPLLLMTITQIIPMISIIYLVSKCNDLVKLVASRTFGSWAFVAVLVGQYIEYTYYAGHRREHMAGKCRLEWVEDWNDLDLDGNPKMILKSQPSVMKKILNIFRKDSKVVPTQHSSASQQEEQEEEKQDKDSLDEEYGRDDDDDDEEEEEKEEEKEKEKVNEIGDDSSVLSSVIPMGLEGGYLQRMKAEAEAAEIAAKQAAIDEIQRKEALVTDWHEWKCLVCGQKNRRPRHPINLSFTPAFYEKGVYLKKIHADLIPDHDMPSCSKCFTLANYQPRLCTAHIFPHYKHPYEAFNNYPEVVPHRESTSKFKTFLNKTISCFFGQRNHPDSRLMINDWRMSIYLSSRFPLIPRPIKDKNDLYEIGEIIECKKQKMNWSRGRIIESRGMSTGNHVYDIIYDTGDEIRLIEEHEIRLPPSKGLYSYHIELYLSLLIVFFPISLIITIYLNQPNLFILPFLFFIISLLIHCLMNFIESFYEYYAAGCCLLFQQYLLFIYPLILFLISTLLLLLTSSYISYVILILFIIFSMFLSLPVIYLKRPTFAILTFIFFIQISISLLLISIRLDGHGHSFIPWVMIDTFPALTSIYTLIRYRRWLSYIWDVSLFIRPVEYAEYEVSSFRRWYDLLKEIFISFRGEEEEKEEGQGNEEIRSGVGGNDLESQTGVSASGTGGTGGTSGGVPSLEMAAAATGKGQKEKEKREKEEKERKERAKMMSMSDDEDDEEDGGGGV